MNKSKTITLNTTVCKKMNLSSAKVAYNLEKLLQEKEQLHKFALKITKVPETVQVYSNPNMGKKRE